MSLWIEIPVAVLLVLSSLFALCGAAHHAAHEDAHRSR